MGLAGPVAAGCRPRNDIQLGREEPAHGTLAANHSVIRTVKEGQQPTSEAGSRGATDELIINHLAVGIDQVE